MSDVYSFQNSVSESAERDIVSVMWAIRGTLARMRADVHKLEPRWRAAEADMYYGAARQLNDGCVEVAKVLDSVEDSLKAVREGTGELRKSIMEVLENSQ